MADALLTPELEAAFAELRSRLVEPEAPALAASVSAASADESAGRHRRSGPGQVRLRVAAVVLVVMALFAVTPVREAVARWLGWTACRSSTSMSSRPTLMRSPLQARRCRCPRHEARSASTSLCPWTSPARWMPIRARRRAGSPLPGQRRM